MLFPVFKMLILSFDGSLVTLRDLVKLPLTNTKVLFIFRKCCFKPLTLPGPPSLFTAICILRQTHVGHSARFTVLPAGRPVLAFKKPSERMGGKQRGWRREAGTRRNATQLGPRQWRPDPEGGTRAEPPRPELFHRQAPSPEASPARSRTSADPPSNPRTAWTRAGSPDAPAAPRSPPGASPTAPWVREIS